MSLDLSPSSGSVCSPPEKRIYMPVCPQCGMGPYVRYTYGPTMCSPACEKRWKKRSEKPRIARGLSKRAKRRLARKNAQRNNELHIRKEVSQRVSSALKSEKRIVKRAAYLRKQYGSSFYTSLEWVAIRYQALSRSKKRCELCRRSDDVVLHVDHIKPRSKHPELSLVLDNLQVLCADCNIGKSNKDDTDWR